MVGERLPPDPPGLGDIMSAGSSTGWTDEKHMLYTSSLEESFVTQLYDGEVNSKGVFCQSSSIWGHDICKRNHTDTIVAQGYWGMDRLTELHPEHHKLGVSDQLHVISIRKIANPILWVMMHQLLSQDKKESVTMQNKRTMERILLPVSTGMDNLLLGQQSYETKTSVTRRLKLEGDKA